MKIKKGVRKKLKVIQFDEFGGPEKLRLIDKDIPTISENEVLVKVKAIGVNYADTARREGQYVVPTPLPYVPGSEIAGKVVEVGSQVEGVHEGKRVVSLIASDGYAEYVKLKASHLIPIPDDVTYENAVALPLQGLSAYHILKTMARIAEGETVLVHAAAGGVGLLAVQLAKIFGAKKVIATASTNEKLSLAKEMGADDLVNYTNHGWEQEVLELTEGHGVDIALEMAGGDVFHRTIKCLAPFGRLIIYGVASGEQAKFYPSKLMRKNQAVIGFFLPQIMKHRTLYQNSLQELMQLVGENKLMVTIGGRFALSEAAHVHEILQGRKTIGKIILNP